jgi:ankyrin repeat protein
MGTDTPEIVRILVNAGADPDEKCGDRGEAGIHLAAVIGSYETVKLLLDKGADINIRTDYNETVLWLAVWKGHVNVCRLLIQKNCTLGVPSNGCQVYAHDYMELELSLGLEYFSIAKMLISAGHPLVNRLYYNGNDLGPFYLKN